MLSCIIVIIFAGFFPNKLQIVMIFICSPVAGTTDTWLFLNCKVSDSDHTTPLTCCGPWIQFLKKNFK